MRLLTILGLIVLLAIMAVRFWYISKDESEPASGIEETTAEVAEDTAGEPVERFVDIAGARVRVREEGPADAPVILLLHGFTFSLETWDGWADELSDRYRIIRYDLLGHGLTGPDPLERYAPEERAQFIGEVMDALGLDQVILGGNSLGGLAAWRFAAMQPERVEALLLVSPGGYPINGVGNEPAEVPPAFAFYLQTVPEVGLRASIANIYGDPSKVSEERIKVLGDMMRQEGNGAAMIRSLEEFTLPDPEPDLAKVTAPTLILWGEADKVISPAQADQFIAAMPNAKLITYPGVGHVAHEEMPAKTAADVAGFLGEVELDTE